MREREQEAYKRVRIECREFGKVRKKDVYVYQQRVHGLSVLKTV